MSDVAIYFARDRMDADVAASALRAARLHPRIALDTPFGQGGITTNTGRRVVYVPASEEGRARGVLQEPRVEETEDNPLLRLGVIAALIVGFLAATAFVAQACYLRI